MVPVEVFCRTIAGRIGQSRASLQSGKIATADAGEEHIMPTLKENVAPPSHRTMKGLPMPRMDGAASAKSLINFLMQDRFFLALYRSNDPNVRAAAIDTLNEAHHQAYGDAPTSDDGTERK